jgi:NADH-quinone oxidoreductase subunit C
MSKKVTDRLKAMFGDKILETSAFRGDDEARVAPGDWLAVATFLRDDGQTLMDHFVDLTAVDYPGREEGRFDVVLFLRSMKLNHRVRLRTRVAEDQPLASLLGVWAGANWAEREAFDMFGIKFEGHPDLRRILMYEEFEGFPLRKDYPIAKVQPLVPYREVEGIEKLAPFGDDEGMPFSRIDWLGRARGADVPVSTGVGASTGARKNLSQGAEYTGAGPTSTDE